MAFTLLCFLGNDSIIQTVDALEKQVGLYFDGDEGGRTVPLNGLPSSGKPNCAVEWDGWRVFFYFECGLDIQEEANEIFEMHDFDAKAFKSSTSRIVAEFSDDPDMEFTEETISVMQFLTSLPHAIVYDPQQGDIVTC